MVELPETSSSAKSLLCLAQSVKGKRQYALKPLQAVIMGEKPSKGAMILCGRMQTRLKLHSGLSMKRNKYPDLSLFPYPHSSTISPIGQTQPEGKKQSSLCMICIDTKIPDHRT